MDQEEIRDSAFVDIQQGSYDLALQKLQKIDESGDTDWNIKYLIGVCYRQTGNLPKAINFYYAAIDLCDPSSVPSAVYNALAIALQLSGDLINAALTIDNSITNLRRDLNYYGQSGVQLDLEQIDNYKSLSAALASSGTTFSLLAEKHSELVQYFLNKSLQAHFDCLGLEDRITREYYVSVCQQIDQDPSQQIDTSSEDFRRHWSIKLKYENLEYCNALLNVASALIRNAFHGFRPNQVMNEASNYLQMAQTIMDENHPKWDALLHVVSAFDEAQKNM